MSNKLNIALVQCDLFWDDPISNKNRLDFLLTNVKDVDLIILPEMFTTAFCMQSRPEQMDGSSVQWMLQRAKLANAAICGSLIINENSYLYNRFVWVSPKGEVEFYDKRHLFSLMGEHKRFVPGLDRKVINYKGWKIFPQICYDLRFPVFSRNDMGYDLLLYVANWPARRITAWDKLLQARAIENLSYVAGVNRIGKDPNNISFVGHSAIYDPLGDSIAFLGSKEKIEIVTIEKKALMAIRESLPFLEDGDRFILPS